MHVSHHLSKITVAQDRSEGDHIAAFRLGKPGSECVPTIIDHESQSGLGQDLTMSIFDVVKRRPTLFPSEQPAIGSRYIHTRFQDRSCLWRQVQRSAPSNRDLA